MLETGATIGAYRILAQIGHGGMATVYKAYQETTDRYVAIKILPPHFANDEKLRQRFFNEARVIASLEHAHVVPIHDFGEQGNLAYIVMRYLPSGTLKEVLARERLPLFDVIRIISQVGSALDYAHRQNIIHRDIKPSNILIDYEGNCYLSDFGIAKMVEDASEFTATGMIGTPAYMSPEQGSGQPVDARSDIYSLGVVLYEMVTGQVPFKAKTPIALIHHHLNAPVLPPRDLNPALPEAVEQVILTALAKQPDARYQSVSDFIADLQRAAGSEAGVGPIQVAGQIAAEISSEHVHTMITIDNIALPPQTAVRQQRRLSWMIVGAVGALTGIVAVILLLSGVFAPGQPAADLAAQPTVTTESSLAGEPGEQPAAADLPTPLPTVTSTPGPTPTPLPYFWQRSNVGEELSDLAPVYDVVTDPLDRLVSYAATYGAGLYKTTNGGQSWAPINEGLEHVQAIDLEIVPGNTRIVLAVTKEGGVYRSEDAGLNWSPSNQGITLPTCTGDLCSLAAAPSDPDRIYLGSLRDEIYYFYSSNDGGLTWVEASSGPKFLSIAVDSNTPDQVYAGLLCVSGEATGDLWRSSDGGQSWESIEITDPSTSRPAETIKEVLVDPTQPDALYVLGEFAFVSPEETRCIADIPYDQDTIGAESRSYAGILHSSDRGETWQLVSNTHSDYGGMTILPETGTLYAQVVISRGTGVAGLDWGLIRYLNEQVNTIDFGSRPSNPSASVINFSLNLPSPETFYVYGFGVSWWAKSSFTGRAKLSALITFGPEITPSGASTETWFGVGLGYAPINLIIDPLTGDILLTETELTAISTKPGVGYFRFQDGRVVIDDDPDFETVYYEEGGGDQPPEYISPEDVIHGYVWPDPDSSELYLGYNYAFRQRYLGESCISTLLRTANNGVSWEEVSLGSELCDAFIRSDGQGQVIYAIDGTHVIRSDDEGLTWSPAAAPPLGTNTIQTAVVNPDNGLEIWLSTKGAGILHSTDGGVNWEAANNGLTSLFVNGFTATPTSPLTLYAATNDGLYISTDGGASWGVVRQGLSASQIIYSVAVDPNDPSRVFITTPDGIFQLVGN